MMTNVLIVEDQRIHREYMENLLLHDGRFFLFPSVTAADVALQLCQRDSIDLILMDIAVNGTMDGVEATAEIKKIRPDIRIVIVTSMIDAQCLAKAKAAGADSMWYKDSIEETLINVIDRTMSGEHIFPCNSPSINMGFVNSDEFTKTENDILRELVNGLSSKQISQKLGISAKTIDWHINNLLKKTGLPNRIVMAIRAVRGNLFAIKDRKDNDTKNT